MSGFERPALKHRAERRSETPFRGSARARKAPFTAFFEARGFSRWAASVHRARKRRTFLTEKPGRLPPNHPTASKRAVKWRSSSGA